MARNVQVASLIVEVTKSHPEMLNLDLQDQVMEALQNAGLEVHSTEVSFVRERRIPTNGKADANAQDA